MPGCPVTEARQADLSGSIERQAAVQRSARLDAATNRCDSEYGFLPNASLKAETLRFHPVKPTDSTRRHLDRPHQASSAIMRAEVRPT